MKGKALLKYSLHAAVLAGVVWAAVKTIDGEEFQRALREFNWLAAPAVGLLGLLSVVIKAWRFASLLRQTVEIGRWPAMMAYIAGQSMTLLPGGIVARAGLLQSVGVKVEKSSPAIALSSMTDQIGFVLCGAVAALWFEAARKPVLVFLAVLSVIGLALGFEATRTWVLRIVEALLGRLNLTHRWRNFLEAMGETLSFRVVVMGVANSLMSFAVLVFALYLCMWAVGHLVNPAVLLLAYTIPAMVGRISAMPGGVGLTEVGMVGVLDRYPDVRLNQAAAAVLVFRIGTVLFTALVGAIVYWTGWRREADKHQAVAA